MKMLKVITLMIMTTLVLSENTCCVA